MFGEFSVSVEYSNNDIEITECDVLWEMSYVFFYPANPTDKLTTIVAEMEMFYCDTEYEFVCQTQTFDFFDNPVTVSQCKLEQLSKV